ncbi:ribonucleoside-diphosphate reductase class Ib glutaredoxin subunit [Rhodococcus sp. OK519]|uniref:glutaredoxin domain-containing protein n=1 Tax=Rhodococcus sp. OK519 TaxID=2135729 RepID=UPI000D3AA00C|nr:ribonucleoside-diphosphate reductase class Ib glutaredoxin subunit [Rhodococcus sp. OK519]
MTVTVYTKKPCVQCDATIRRLDKNGIEYRLAEFDEAAIAWFKAEGHMQAPVVVAGDRVWSGYSPDRIDALMDVPVVRDVRVRATDLVEREGLDDRG